MLSLLPAASEFCDLLPASEEVRSMPMARLQRWPMTSRLSHHWQRSRPPLPGLLPEERRRYYGIVMLPNVCSTCSTITGDAHTFSAGPDRTLITCDWLFDPGAMQAPDFDPMDAVAIFDLVNRQDWRYANWLNWGCRPKPIAAEVSMCRASSIFARCATLCLQNLGRFKASYPLHWLANSR